MTNVKIKYDNRHIVFYTYFKGAYIEVMRASATLELAQVMKLRKLADIEARGLISTLSRMAA